MATLADIQDVVDQIDRVWANPPARNQLFGNVLRAVGIQGIRGLTANVEFTWPVTAIGGTNGSGKTTFLQVSSAAYVAESGGRQVKLGSWIRGALQGDTPPIQLPASISYSFVDGTPSFQVDYLADRTRWNYPRRGNPIRNVEFVGITTFAPRVEKRDRVHHAGVNLQVLQSTVADPRIVESVSRILGTSYTSLTQHTVGIPGKWDDSVPQLTRYGTSYSESHMGAGEQKVVRLVETIESMPARSLVLLEEPELTLHPDAQIGLAWYLMAVARRKGHQILVATHSEHLFQSLPRQARVLLVRTSGGMEVLHDVSSLRAARELTNTMRTNAPLILVEDAAAAAFLGELLRQTNRGLHANCALVAVGNDDDVRRLTSRMRQGGLRVVGVRDGDREEAAGDLVFSLPGGAAPETVLISHENLDRAEPMLAGLREAYDRSTPSGRGHQQTERDKRVLAQMARELDMSEEELASRLTQIWLISNKDDARVLAEKIQGALEAA